MANQDRWVVTRVLESAEGNVEIKIGQPEKVIDDEWSCAYSVAEETSYAHGLDSFQALLMALTGMRVALDNLKSKLKWRGGKAGDHGIPRMVPHAFGVDFSRKIEEVIDSEINQFAANAESAAKARYAKPSSNESFVASCADLGGAGEERGADFGREVGDLGDQAVEVVGADFAEGAAAVAAGAQAQLAALAVAV